MKPVISVKDCRVSFGEKDTVAIWNGTIFTHFSLLFSVDNL